MAGISFSFFTCISHKVLFFSICAPFFFFLMICLTSVDMRRITYLREGESTACPFVVFIGALKLKVLPPNSPQHSSQLLLQLQFPAEKGKTPGGGVNKNQESQAKWVWIAAEACWTVPLSLLQMLLNSTLFCSRSGVIPGAAAGLMCRGISVWYLIALIIPDRLIALSIRLFISVKFSGDASHPSFMRSDVCVLKPVG